MKLGIIILNWQQAADTIACCRAVQAWSLPAAVWVVDNGSPDDSAARIRAACPTAVLLQNETNLGFAGGNNVALSAVLAADCEAVLLLNNDARIEEAALARLLQFLEDHSELGIVGPSLWDQGQPERLLSAGGDDIGLRLNSHLRRLPPPDDFVSVPYVPGTCVLVRTAVLHQVGLLDEAYFFGGELADLCARARAAGYGCAVVGEARAYHEVDRSRDTRRYLHIYYVLRNRFLFVRKFHASQKRRLYFFWSWQSLLAWADAVRRREWRRARAVRLAVWDGWRGRFGGQNERVSRGAIR